MKIMVVEDDSSLASEIKQFLEKWGYEVNLAQRFDAVRQEFVECRAQLVLMDINLPFYDGFYWCSQIRQISQVPVLFISSRNDDRDQIMAIAQGGDDYVEKPFQLELLKAKIEAILRRTYQYQVKEQLVLREGLVYDTSSQMLYYQNREIELTKSEQKIFRRLVSSRGDIVSREELMNALWDTDEYVSDGTLTTLISRLRRKLQEVCGEEIISTRKGQGYLL